jgi:hypothetical protein
MAVDFLRITEPNEFAPSLQANVSFADQFRR